MSENAHTAAAAGSPELRGSSVLLLGFGREGRSTLAYLRACRPELRIAAADRRLAEPPDPEIELWSGDAHLDALTRFETVIRSPGIPLGLPELQRAAAAGVHITSATNLFFSEAPGRIAAVTGTKGKSTTAALLAHIMSGVHGDVRLAGNIGTPMLDCLAGADAGTLFILECSSFQLEDFRGRPHLAVLLNVVEEHLDYHGSFTAYRNAKANLLRRQTSDDVLICNPSWPAVAELISTAPARLSVFGDVPGSLVRVEGGWLRSFSKGVPADLCRIGELPLLGPGNVQNALAAAAAALQLGAPGSAVAHGLRSFQSLPCRLEPVGCVRGIDFVNDSLSTIPQAAINALEGLGGSVQTIILGGHDRGLDYAILARALACSPVETILLFPESGERIRAACKACGVTARMLPVQSMHDAVQLGFEYTDAGRICLLSPASSSLNMFKDYRERGEQFSRLVHELGATSGGKPGSS